ncbi:serine hydrolase domain-containing protein [Micromonospora sp. WMMD729]|uniref:serine hydrolase domain-containing protein n=1 Tax=Micromonospora sp. WMMD729 TaxID=3404127 RepID=UPI003BF5DBC6
MDTRTPPTRTRRLLAAAACALALTTTPVPAIASPTTPDELNASERYLHTYQQQTRAPGLAYAVIRGTQVIQRGAWGVDGNGRPMTTQTPFLLGSTSKSFTALAVTQLAESGQINLDTTVATYLPWLRLADPATTRTVTVRHLLTHTSGLPQVWSTDLTDRYDNQPGGLTRSVRDLTTVRPIAGVGETYRYSDANYMILGALVENVTGDTFGRYLRRNVLDPLAMTHSAATADEARAAALPPGHRYYLGRPQRFAAPFDTAGVPYGFLAASLDDLTHYAIAHLDDGRYAQNTLLSPQGIRQLHTGTVDTGHGTYGLGWQNSTLDGVGAPIVWHAGATPDYFTHIVLAPETNLGVVVMTNVYGLAMDAPLSAAAFNLARILHGGTPATATADPVHNWTLAGLLAVATALLSTLGWSLIRARRTRRQDPRTPARTSTVTLLWLAGCATVATAAARQLPRLFQGADLAKLSLWAPDIGHAIALVIALSAALALTRLAIGAHTMTTRRPRQRSAGHPRPLTRQG